MNRINNFKNSIHEKSKLITNKILKGKEFNPIFDDEAVNYSIKAFLVVIAALVIPNVSLKYIMIFDNILFKIIFVGLIALIAFRDPVSSLLLAIIFILAIQRIHNDKINNPSNQQQQQQQKQEPTILSSNEKEVSNNVDIDINYNSATNEVNTTEKKPDQAYPVKDPSSDVRFTTDRQFIDAQSNIVPNSSYMGQVKTFETQFGTQGLEDGVQGYSISLGKDLTELSSVFSL